MDPEFKRGAAPEKKRRMPKGAVIVISVLFTAAATFGASWFLGSPLDPVAAALCFIAASIVLTAAMTHLKSPAIIAGPVIGAAAAIFASADPLLAIVAASSALVFSGITAVLLLRSATRFHTFLFCSATSFCSFSAYFAMTLTARFGSLGDALDKYTAATEEAVVTIVKLASDTGRIPEGAIPDADLLTEAAVAMTPAVLMIASMAAALAVLLLLKLVARIAGTKELLFRGRITVPRPFAVIFVIVTVLTVFAGFIPEPVSYVIENLESVFMAIFAGYGAIEIVRILKNPRTPSKLRTVLIVVLVALLLFGGVFAAFIIPLCVPVLSYFGAFRAVREKNEGSEK